MAQFIGMTESGDAGWDTSWRESLKDSIYAGGILITKAVSRQEFQEKALEMIKEKPIIIHAGVTGWGGTPMEPGAKGAITSLNAIRNLIDNGFPARNIVLRVDPIIPTEEGLERAASVVKLAKEIIPDVTRIRISIYDDYHHSREEMQRRGFAPIDNFTKWKNEMERRPTEKQVRDVAEALLAVAKDTQIFELCAEPELAKACPERFQWFGCLSRKDCEIMGVTVPEGIGINGQQRFGCRCLRMKRELLHCKCRCANNCAYCYWKNPPAVNKSDSKVF